ncbi:MAG: hypothetical protein DCC43_14750 [Candidatus Brocadia sp.]|nr:hypothetical protein [Candidatus Brocadia sp. AMX3]RIJ90619.1 MAG: hypothetical protein DCC43_14750 [Candidatus Brocadia sp.]
MNTFIPIYGKCFALTQCGNIVIMVIFQKTKVLQIFLSEEIDIDKFKTAKRMKTSSLVGTSKDVDKYS